MSDGDADRERGCGSDCGVGRERRHPGNRSREAPRPFCISINAAEVLPCMTAPGTSLMRRPCNEPATVEADARGAKRRGVCRCKERQFTLLKAVGLPMVEETLRRSTSLSPLAKGAPRLGDQDESGRECVDDAPDANDDPNGDRDWHHRNTTCRGLFSNLRGSIPRAR